MRGKCDNKEGYLDGERLLPRALVYKRGSDIQEDAIT